MLGGEWRRARDDAIDGRPRAELFIGEHGVRVLRECTGERVAPRRLDPQPRPFTAHVPASIADPGCHSSTTSGAVCRASSPAQAGRAYKHSAAARPTRDRCHNMDALVTGRAQQSHPASHVPSSEVP